MSVGETVQLFLHASMCKMCGEYEKQSIFLEKYLEKLFKTNIEKTDKIKVPEGLKKEIIKKLEEEVI
ncbi:MAG: hypothetical protein M3Q58_15480 [Bacteroidota bacterium]|nr:hypothetical protein [Bacteroidota bacterium]